MLKSKIDINYNNNIDFLRAISVLAVLVYHLEIFFFDKQILRGGFLGVDIFFLISGYLITFILIKDFTLTKKFNFLNFFSRRVTRILPTLIFTILLSFFIATFILLPESLEVFKNSSFSSLMFFSNYFFLLKEFNYGENLSSYVPLLHTWSLSVEWQFYLIYPFILLLLFKKKTKFFLFLIIVLSLIMLHFFSKPELSSLNFYSLHFRVWEFLIGALIFLYKNDLQKFFNKKNFLLVTTINYLSLLLIFLSMLYFKDAKSFPSFLTLTILIPTGILIITKKNDNVINFLFNFKLTKYLGKMSYSLYLIHFPVIVFYKHIFFEKNEIDKFFLVTIIFILSIFTYHFVEKKYRYYKMNIKKISLISISAVLIFMFVGIISPIVNNNFFINNNSELVKNMSLEDLVYKNKNKFGKNCFGISNINNFCHYKSNGNKIKNTIFIIGDCFAETFSPILSKNLPRENYDFISMNSSNCYFLPNFNSKRPQTKDLPCDIPFQEKRLKKIKENPGSIIILSGLWTMYFKEGTFLNPNNKEQDMFDGYKKTISSLIKDGHKIIQMTPPIIYPEPVSNKIFFYSKYVNKSEKYLKNITRHPEKYYLKRNERVIDFFKTFESKNYKVFNTNEVFCKNSYCNLNNEKKVFYLNKYYLTYNGSELIYNSFIKYIKSFD
jgi:peptidoglycan/LPS O-acetylase OafA/YrhL